MSPPPGERLVQIFETVCKVAHRILAWEVASKPHALNAEFLGLACDRALTLLETGRRGAWKQAYIKDQEARRRTLGQGRVARYAIEVRTMTVSWRGN